jgi:hypothetical protein
MKMEIPADLIEKAREIRQSVVWKSSTSIEEIARALLAERLSATERAAKIVEDGQEVVSLTTNRRFIEPRGEGNLAGIAFAAAIRSQP